MEKTKTTNQRIEGKVEAWSEHIPAINSLCIFEIGEMQSRISVRCPVKPKEYGFSLTVSEGLYHNHKNINEMRDNLIYSIGGLMEREDVGDPEEKKDYFDPPR